MAGEFDRAETDRCRLSNPPACRNANADTPLPQPRPLPDFPCGECTRRDRSAPCRMAPSLRPPLLPALRRARKAWAATFLLDRASEELSERLAAVLRRFELRLISAHRVTRSVERWRRAQGRDIIIADPLARDAAPRAVMNTGGTAGGPERCGRSRRGSVAIPDGPLDLVVSALAPQFVNEPPGTR